MLSLAFIAALAATDTDPAVLRGPVPVVLVLTSGKGMRVKGYSIDGNRANVTALDGTPMVLRATQIDVERTDAATASAIAKAIDEQEAADAAEVEAEAERAAKADRIARAKARPRRAGSMSVADGSAAKEVEAVQRAPEPAEPAPSGGSPGVSADRRSAIEQEIARLEARAAVLRKDLSEAQANLARAGDLSTAAAYIRGQILNIHKELDPIESDLKVARDARAKLK